MNKIRLLTCAWKPLKSFTRQHSYPAPFIHYLQNLPSTLYSKLMNGLTVVTEERECYNTCIGLFMDAGSRYESNFENGIAHFFEHIAFKGTNARTRQDLEAQMECLGARFKCLTTRELVVYSVECLCQDTPLAVDILADCVFNNSFNPNEIEYQKRTVYAEMIEHDKNPRKLLFDYLHSSAFQGTPLGQSVMGPSSNLYNFTDVTICRYLSKCFDPCRTVLAAVGGIKHEQVVALANCYLNKLEPLKCIDMDAYRYSGSDVRYRDDSMPTAHVVIAVEGPCLCDDDKIVMDIAQYIIGGWDRSQPGGQSHPVRVAREASIHNMCDAYQAFNITYKDCGLFGVHFISKIMSQEDMMALIQDEFMYLSTCVTNSEVERAKCFLKAKILSETESSHGTCMEIGRWTLYYGCRPSLLQQMNAIDRISVAHVRSICNKYFYNRCPVVVAIGPTEALSEYNRIRSNMWWLRV
uniref:Peptidase M16 N-terminal domain-containing protein n=1 Tax=Heliothis virescens TaxID=7102 RepID=A0A2A4K0M0_HELVI